MARIAQVPDLNVDDAIPEAFTDALTNDVNYLVIAGADIAALGAGNTLSITSSFHKVTVATGTIDNIDDAAGEVVGQPVRLWFQNAQTIRNNGGGTGNVRTALGGDRPVAANEIVTFVYDGATWREQGPLSGMTKLWDSTEAGVVFPAASITTPALAQGYSSLRVVMTARGTARFNPRLRFNGDAAASYRRSTINGSGLSVAAGVSVAEPGITMGVIVGDPDVANSFAAHEILIPHYTSNHHKPVLWRGFSSQADSTGSGDNEFDTGGGLWENVAAISTLTFVTSTGSYAAGTRITIYGEA